MDAWVQLIDAQGLLIVIVDELMVVEQDPEIVSGHICSPLKFCKAQLFGSLLL